jgi:hypothetical protein
MKFWIGTVTEFIGEVLTDRLQSLNSDVAKNHLAIEVLGQCNPVMVRRSPTPHFDKLRRPV